jgi:serine/threonine protein kinase
MQENDIILKKYRIGKIIGRGVFGTVYNGYIISSGERIAIKTEPTHSEINILKHETTILNHLYQKGCRCTPIVYWYGINKQYSCLIMPYYKTTLYEYIYKIPKKELTIEKINNIMIKLIQLLENIHKHYVIHRDIKPQNFMINERGNLYLIDFGFATFYVNENMKHIELPTSKKEHVIGNPKYMSIHIHNGIEATRRDDLISLGYMYIQFIMGSLVWDDCYLDKEKDTCFYPETHILHYRNIQRRDLKSWCSVSLICKSINDNIYRYMEHCYVLPFKEEPNYTILGKLFD